MPSSAVAGSRSTCPADGKENVTWGYDRIAGAIQNLGHAISDTTVGNILKQLGIEPAPDRKRQTIWSTFIKAHWTSFQTRHDQTTRLC
ncbi:MAG: transposase [Planctomycetaceae bacterium]|nr:transposase [Planctomycetales bacterium]MCB9922158.1 transposase [Planctomycetaceae bacterium]